MVQTFKAAYYGEPGAYSEQAALQHFGGNAKLKGCKFIAEVLESAGKDCKYGIIPIENSIEGAVTQTYDLLLDSDLTIIGEEIVKVSHCLMANKGTAQKDIRNVYSHPQALGQCRGYIEKHKLNSIPYYDTAGSARMIKEEKPRNSAAIASKRAAELYGLDIIATGIESNHHNYTRFIVVAEENKTARWDKTSIAFSEAGKDKPGFLFKALNCFADNGVNLLYIQSRPIPGRPWEYNFYVDCRGSMKERKITKSINALNDVAGMVKVLGSYKSARFNHV